jgi:hypothetical protein
MPEPTQLRFSHKEVATALIKDQGIREGIWGLHVRFGIKAMNIGASDDDLQPSAIVPVLTIGLQRFDKVNNLSVDAAEVNPPPPRTPKLIGSGKTQGVGKRAKIKRPRRSV